MAFGNIFRNDLFSCYIRPCVLTVSVFHPGIMGTRLWDTCTGCSDNDRSPNPLCPALPAAVIWAAETTGPDRESPPPPSQHPPTKPHVALPLMFAFAHMQSYHYPCLSTNPPCQHSYIPSSCLRLEHSQFSLFCTLLCLVVRALSGVGSAAVLAHLRVVWLSSTTLNHKEELWKC